MAKKKSQGEPPRKPARASGPRKKPRAKQPHPPQESSRACPIVGIGASAGGLEATLKFLQAMPHDSGMGFVLIQHLDPHRVSLTAELLSKRTKMEVSEAADATRVERDHLYVIPPGRYLAVNDGVLQVSNPDAPRGARTAIDFFLRSLAEDCREKAIAIILSGTGTDGVLGARAIKAQGGLTIAQDPAEAQHQGMPSSAIAAGVVDHVLPVEKMPELLISYARHPYTNGRAIEAEESQGAKGSQELNAILNWLRAHSKHDFRTYKKATLSRRTARRMSLHRLESLGEYLAFLRDHPEEAALLIKDLLINVTEFFREPQAWRELEHLVLAPLVASKPANAPLRIWIPACSTGEEPYTVAMLAAEQVQRHKTRSPIQIFATDVDREALEVARAGRYPASIAADVSPERLARFFVEHAADHTFEVTKALREMVMFAEQNLISDPPFSRLDLICCRNVLIYLEPDVQEKIISLFHFALAEKGVLFLGNAETIGRQNDLFQPISQKWRIFRRVGPPRHEHVVIPVLPQGVGKPAETPLVPPQRRMGRLAQVAQQRLLDRLAPASVLVDQHFEILHFCGPTDGFLEQPAGAPTSNLLDRVRDGLRSKVRAAVRQALAENRSREAESRVRRGRKTAPARITVIPIHDAQTPGPLALVIFEDIHSRQAPEEKSPPQIEAPAALEEEESLIRQLERELLTAKDDLQATLEQYETSNEELKASNEEMMSINEELQSSNEELETSKEELQSLNEELATVNSQLAAKIEEVEARHDDLTNLLASSDLATLCLDAEGRIKWFTPAMQGLVSLVRADIGRPLGDLANRFAAGNLLDAVAGVLRSLRPDEREVVSEDGRCFLRRILPFRAAGNRIEGVVATFTDITKRKQAEDELRRMNESLEQAVQQRTRLLRLVRDVAAAANEADSPKIALHFALEAICTAENWDSGLAYLRDASGEFAPVTFWPAEPPGAPVAKKNSGIQAPPLEKQQIEELLRSGQPGWLSNLVPEAKNPPGRLQEGSPNAAIWFPVFVGRLTVGVLEFHSRGPVDPDRELLEAMHNIGTQLGQVVERKELEKQAAEATDREQRRIGQELHDGLGQQISGLAMMAATMTGMLERDKSPHAPAMRKLLETVEQAKVQARALSKGLTPVEVEGQGLMAALQELTESVQKVHRVECVFQCPKPVLVKDSFTATHLYRIGQEAVHNAVKHARPRRVTVSLSHGGGVTLSVRNDGGGFAKSPEQMEGHGMRIMRYRAGLIGAKLTIHSKPEGGAEIVCSLSRELLQ